ncbi:MAG: hypothetical protein H0U91_15105 [Rubrobacter sp.]|nr:hypothetical protein [Rubrobacter sp.]
MLEQTTLLLMGREGFPTSTEKMRAIARNLVGILPRRLGPANTHARNRSRLPHHPIHDPATLGRRARWFADG